jgi:hypothetical protein
MVTDTAVDVALDIVQGIPIVDPFGVPILANAASGKGGTDAKCGWPVGDCDVTTDELLQKMLEFLGEGYVEIKPGVFQSKPFPDGSVRQVRITDSELSPKGGNRVHANFETLRNVGHKKSGKPAYERESNSHYNICD